MYKPELKIKVTAKAQDYDVLKQEILTVKNNEVYLGLYYFRVFKTDVFKVMVIKKKEYDYEILNYTKESKSIRGAYRVYNGVKKRLIADLKRKKIASN